MKSFIQTGQGNLRTYLTFVFLTGFLALFSLQSASAQVDVNIIVFEVAAPSGGGIVSVNPNPVSRLANVEYKTGVSVQSLTILSSEGSTLATMSIGDSNSFNVELPTGLTHWIFQTSAGVVSRQILIAESW